MNSVPRPAAQRLVEIANEFAGRRVVVVGDLIADQFLYGEIARVSREAPVFILRHEHTDTVPGGAANCAVNLAALGARAALVGLVGDDATGRTLLNKLQIAGVDCCGIIAAPGVNTTAKLRIIAGQAHSTRQQVIRVDYEPPSQFDAWWRENLQQNLRAALSPTEAVIISDYNYGVADHSVVALLHELRRTRLVPIIADSRFRLSEYAGFTSATPNEDELEHTFGRRLGDQNDLEQAAAQLRARLACPALLVTRGPQGMLLQEENQLPQYLTAVGAHDPVDVTGAGDTVIAAYTLALAGGATFAEAACLANYAGGLVVMKRGTASVSAAELISSIQNAES